MVNATACHAVDCEFDPRPSRHFPVRTNTCKSCSGGNLIAAAEDYPTGIHFMPPSNMG